MSQDFFFIVAIIGLSGMTWLFPCMGWAMAKLSFRERPAGGRTGRPPIIDILIPAHNEEGKLAVTLESVLREARGIPAVRVIVGADACSDRTVVIAQTFGVGVVEYPKNRSKWLTLRKLVEHSRADWVVLVDAGIQWPEGMLKKMRDTMMDGDTVGVAPGYAMRAGGIAENLHWALERFLKSLENHSGGPISIHGATVAYRREVALDSMNALGKELWLNDDVVLPLMIRSRHPQSQIFYDKSFKVFDDLKATREEFKADSDFRRRRRMMQGNLQWMRNLYPEVMRGNPIAGVLLMRRAFRVLWAYWFMSLGLCLTWVVLSLIEGWSGPGPAIAFGVSIGLVGLAGLSWFTPGRKLSHALAISLMAPFEGLRMLVSGHRVGAWK